MDITPALPVNANAAAASPTAADEALLIRSAAMAGLLRGERLENLLELIVLATERETGDLKCAILLADKAGRNLTLAAAPSLHEAIHDYGKLLPIAENSGFSGIAAYRRQEAGLDDIFSAPASEACREHARLAGIASGWAIPLLGPQQELLGTFSTYCPTTGGVPASLRPALRQASQVATLLILHYRQTAAVHAGEATFHGLFKGLEDALLVVDEAGRVLDANPAAERLTGQDRASLLGSPPDFGNSDRTRIDNAISEALAGRPQEIEAATTIVTTGCFTCA